MKCFMIDWKNGHTEIPVKMKNDNKKYLYDVECEFVIVEVLIKMLAPNSLC